MKAVGSREHLSSSTALWHLGFRQTLKGAIILGGFVGLMAIIQGLGFASTYPDEKSRTAFAATMESAPALGILYGETKNLLSSAGYVVYRTVPIMGLVAAIWGLMAVTKLIRGQEEDGHFEVVTSGSTTPRKATGLLLLGFISSLTVAFLISTLFIIVAGSLPDLAISAPTSFLMTLAIFLPALLFGGIGLLTSQLSITRRRAILYGLTPLVILFAIRSIANVVSDLYWLKTITPFGWSDMISPVFDPQTLWLIPFILASPLFIIAGVYLAGKRDLGTGFIPESTTQQPRFFLLKNPTALALRQNLPLFISWTITALGMSVLLASLMTVAAEGVADSPSLKVFISQLGGSVTDLKIAFLGAGMMFVVIVLLIMAATCMASIRKDEAKSYLDNLLTQPVRRSSWLGTRVLLIVAMITLISLLCAFVTWLVAGFQDIRLDLENMLLLSIALTGIIFFLLGVGVLLYGVLPRLAVAAMYVITAWSFLIDIVGSVVKLDDLIIKSSLLHYVSLSPTTAPDWGTFGWLASLGTVMVGVGIIAFTKRDITTE